MVPWLLTRTNFLVGRRGVVALLVEAQAVVFEHFATAATMAVGGAVVIAGDALFIVGSVDKQYLQFCTEEIRLV